MKSIVRAIGKPPRDVMPAITNLVDSGALEGTPRAFSLTTTWRRILSDVVAIEAKVTDWRQGARQAARNRLLAHRSFLALPKDIARRAASDPYVASNGLGVFEVDPNGSVRVLRRSPKRTPRVPYYYYSVANLIACE